MPGPLLVVLVVAASVRALAAWAWDLVGSSGALRVKAELRTELLTALETRPTGVPGFPTARVATLLGAGLDALDAYFGTYLPQLVLTMIATPVLIVTVWIADPLSGLVLVIVLPLIPVFMALIGMATEAVQRRQWQSLASLSRGFFEVVGGLSTLVAFGRAERQVARIRAVTDDYRARTMKVLRITFLSGFTLEFAASLSVALVAVSIGLRLVGGDMTLVAGLFVLVLAPEVFLPLRNVGAAFHSSAAGLTASSDAFDLLAAAQQPRSDRAAGALDADPRDSTSASASAAERVSEGLLIEGLTLRRGDRVVLDGLGLEARRGEVVAITGESGSGKSSLFAALLGFADATGGVTLDGRRVEPGDRSSIAWAGQAPALLAGTIAENVRLGDEGADPAVLAACPRPRRRGARPPASARAWRAPGSRAVRRNASRPRGRSTACSPATGGCCCSTSRLRRRTRIANSGWADDSASLQPTGASCSWPPTAPGSSTSPTSASTWR